ncbi:hypothetical protein BCAR13_870033 [Paraburkholderia caribensis]|nr:hypothetical protein BCAR13_870033 [Paraburkholderia caribensis]
MRKRRASGLASRVDDVRLTSAPAAAVAAHADAVARAEPHHQQRAHVAAEHVDRDVEAAAGAQRVDLRGLPQEAQDVLVRPVCDDLVVPGRVEFDDFVDIWIVFQDWTAPAADAGDQACRWKLLAQRFEEWGGGEQFAEIVGAEDEDFSWGFVAWVETRWMEAGHQPDWRFD